MYSYTPVAQRKFLDVLCVTHVCAYYTSTAQRKFLDEFSSINKNVGMRFGVPLRDHETVDDEEDDDEGPLAPTTDDAIMEVRVWNGSCQTSWCCGVLVCGVRRARRWLR